MAFLYRRATATSSGILFTAIFMSLVLSALTSTEPTSTPTNTPGSGSGIPTTIPTDIPESGSGIPTTDIPGSGSGIPTNIPTEGDVILANYTYGNFEGFSFSGGRVEVYVNGTYRPVCDQDWTTQNAEVVCNFNGYSKPIYRGQATGNSTFGLSSQRPVIVNGNCNGTEYYFEDCDGYSVTDATTDYCLSGQYQAGVRCLEVLTTCFTDGDIELNNYVYEGGNRDVAFSFTARVDYCYNETLRGICDVGWTNNDAAVACRRYGDRYLGEAIIGMPYGPRVPVIDNVTCNGTEYTLDECLTSEPGQVSPECTESSLRAAGVRCYQVCYDGDARLVGGEHLAIGRVEVCSNNVWGTVCDLDWDRREAVPACRSAGFYWGGMRIPNTGFGVGSGPILAANISCNGTEYSLSQCYNTTDIPSVCTHDRDAAISCQPGFIDMDIAINGNVEIAEGNNVTLWCNAQSNSVANLTSYTWRNSEGEILSDGGRVNITLHNGSYSNYYGQFIFNSSLTLSPLRPSDGYNYTCELTIALPQVGVNISNTTSIDLSTYTPGSGSGTPTPTPTDIPGSGSGTVPTSSPTDIPGSGSGTVPTSSPTDIPGSGSGTVPTSSPTDMPGSGSGVPTPPEGDVILANYSSNDFDGFLFSGGRVEVYVNGTYRPVCDQDWTTQHAEVLCNIYGYSKPNYRAQATGNSTYGLSSQRPVIVNGNCSGTEYSLEECDGYSVTDATTDYCLSGQYQAGVTCVEVVTPCYTDGDIEFSNTFYEGDSRDFVSLFTARVDYCFNGTLRGICDVGWTDNDAVVACRRYGDRYMGEAIIGIPYGPRVPVIDNVTCNGTEYTLDECLTSEPGQVSPECTESSSRAAGVRCYRVCYDGDARLVGGEHFAIGRVEVCSNNVWGTVCDLDWDRREAVAACRSAGFYWGGMRISNSGFGVGSGPILAANISCNGTEYSLSQCYNTTDIPSVCTHDRDAAISCQPGFIDMDIAINGSVEIAEGNNVTLWCNAQSNSVANLTSYTWRNSEGEVLSDGGRVNITLHNGSYSNYYGQFIFNSSLTFSPLRPSDGDTYVCELTIALPQVGVNISNTTSTDLRIRVQPPTVNVSYTTPFVNSSFTATCEVPLSPRIPVSLSWITVGDSRPFDDTITINSSSSTIIASILNSVQLSDRLQYTCSAEINGSFVYAQTRSYRNISIIPILVPTLVQGLTDENIVVSSSSVRLMENLVLSATFTCTVDSQPLAQVAWFFNGNETINNSRISIRTDLPSQERQVSVLTISPVELRDQGLYTCSATSPYGSTSSTANLNIFVVPDEVLVEATSGVNLTEGDTIALNCSIDGSLPPATEIQWLRNGIPILSRTDQVTIETAAPRRDRYGLYLQTSTLMISDTHPVEDSGVYTCKAFLRSPGIPTVTGDISISIQARNECTLQLDPLVTPCVNGYCVDGFNMYTCICYDGYTGRNCDEEVTVRTPPVIVDPPAPTSGRVGQAINLTCTITGSPTPAIMWLKDGTVVEGAIFQYLYFPSVRPEDRGYYSCVATNSEGTVQSTRVPLRLNGIQQFNAALTFLSGSSESTSELVDELVGQMIGDLGVAIYSVTLIGDDSLLVTVVTEEGFPSGGVGDALSDQITATAEAAGIAVTVQVTRFDGCPMEQGPAYQANFRITWPELDIGQTATESCPCGSLNTSEINFQATRVCGGNYSNGGEWGLQDVSLCTFSNTTLQLCQISELPVDEQASGVVEIVSDPTVVDAEIFSVATEIVAGLLADVDSITSPEVLNDVLDIVDDLLDVDSTTSKESQEQSRSSSVLLSGIEGFGGSVTIPPGQSAVTFSQENYAISAEEFDSENFEGVTFSTNSNDNFDDGRIGTSAGVSIPDGSIASITLPSSLLDEGPNMTRRLSFSVFADNTLFQSRGDGENIQVGSVVISATLHGSTVSGLPDPVTIQFQKTMENAQPLCVFWDPDQDGGYGGYSTDGCRTSDEEEVVTCSCDHLTSFTILLNDTVVTTEPTTRPVVTTQPTTRPSPTTPDEEESVDEEDEGSDHNTVVFLLLSISLVVLILTIILHLGLKALRDTHASKILVNMDVSLIALYFVTMLAYGEDMPEGACHLWAFLMVYFFIVALIWTFVEAFLMVLRQKLSSFDDRFSTRNYVWVAMPIAWGVPLIPAFVSLAGLDYFGEYRLCQVYNWPFYAFLIAPFIIIYTFNWLIYIAMLARMTRTSAIPQGGKVAYRSNFHHVFSAMLLSLLFGIGWAFGFVASGDLTRDAYLTTQYLFSFLILAHTILQLLLYLPSHDDLRQLWYRVTRQTQHYKVSSTDEDRHRKRSNKYLPTPLEDKDVEVLSLEESVSSSEKKPVGDTTTAKSSRGAVNRLADDKDAITSYTNKEAIEASDEDGEDEKTPISSL